MSVPALDMTLPPTGWIALAIVVKLFRETGRVTLDHRNSPDGG